MQPELRIQHFIFRELYQSPDDFYRISYQPKTKFGAPQLNSNGSSRMRSISRPVYSLKAIQKQINDILRGFYLPDCMYGGITGKNSVLNALQHIDSTYFLTIDLKNFFGSISNSRIHQTLTNRGLSWDDARFITRMTTFNNSLPQGAPTSTILANLAFTPTAISLENFCKELNIVFTVFVDDLTFSSTKSFKHHTDQIIKIIYNNRFYINQKKIHYKRHCCEITGLIVKKGKLHLPKEMLKNIYKPEIKRYADFVASQYNTHVIKQKGALRK